MKSTAMAIAIGGEKRLLKAVKERVRAKCQGALSTSANRPEKAAIEEKIGGEAKAEMKRVASPYSLWSAH